MYEKKNNQILFLGVWHRIVLDNKNSYTIHIKKHLQLIDISKKEVYEFKE